MACPFCDRLGIDLPSRIFYEDVKLGWFAFLGAPPHTNGHTILAARKRKQCPQDLDQETLTGLDEALCAVAKILRLRYPEASDILFSSLRGDKRHFHIHLLPLWPEEEQGWKRVTGYQDSHLMEFLGALERKHDFEVLHRAVTESKSEDAQRREWAARHTDEIEALRRISGYSG